MYRNKTILTIGLAVLLTGGLSYAAGIYPGFREDFESYDVGSDINGQGQWADPGWPGFHDGGPIEILPGEFIPTPSLIVHQGGGHTPFTTKFLTDTGQHWIDDPDPEAEPDDYINAGEHVGYLPLETPATEGIHQFEADAVIGHICPHRILIHQIPVGNV